MSKVLSGKLLHWSFLSRYDEACFADDTLRLISRALAFRWLQDTGLAVASGPDMPRSRYKQQSAARTAPRRAADHPWHPRSIPIHISSHGRRGITRSSRPGERQSVEYQHSQCIAASNHPRPSSSSIPVEQAERRYRTEALRVLQPPPAGFDRAWRAALAQPEPAGLNQQQSTESRQDHG